MAEAGKFGVAYDPRAEQELKALSRREPKEFNAVLTAIDKLRHVGPTLPAPHQSGIRGKDGRGLRELRPRQGRSRWRPIYARVTETVFVILAIAPEAQIDKRGLRQGGPGGAEAPVGDRDLGR